MKEMGRLKHLTCTSDLRNWHSFKTFRYPYVLINGALGSSISNKKDQERTKADWEGVLDAGFQAVVLVIFPPDHQPSSGTSPSVSWL
jgi:hypothetical protein